ncbi:MAG TPA: PPK2 family polyphosphate kinase [Drouetiella sp.]
MKVDAKNLDAIVEKLIVPDSEKISLKKDFATELKHNFSKDELKETLANGIKLLAEQQDKLYAQHTYGLLILIQAMDAAGKDSTIKHVMSGINPQGCDVYSFKSPSSEELSHDYLWRCSKAAPERGKIVIFNRSYYEEVLVTKVHPNLLLKQNIPEELRDKDIYERRYEEIRNYEKYLVNNGFPVVKIFLNVSKEEQRKRFLDRIDLQEKNWKFNVGDAFERERWDDYQNAYEHCIGGTSTKHSPWYVVPADYKPLARLLVGYIIFKELKKLKLKYPEVDAETRKQILEAKKMLSK